MRGERKDSTRIGSTVGAAAFPIAASLVLIMATGAGASQPDKGIQAPFKGSLRYSNYSSSAGSGTTNVYNGGFFNFSSGTAGSAATVTASSTRLVTYASGINISIGEFSRVLTVTLDFPFHNASGTKTLKAVTVHFNYSVSGNLSLVSGTCPWVKAYHHGDECRRMAEAYAYLVPVALVRLPSHHAIPNQNYSCTACTFAAAYEENYSLNNTHGLSSNSTSNLGNVSFSNSTTGAFKITLSNPATKSDTYGVEFVVVLVMESEIQASSTRGGLYGASASAAINFATAGNGLTISSIVGS